VLVAGEYADALRAVGRFLEQLGASEVGVIDQDDEIEVSWRSRAGVRQERRLNQVDLIHLRGASVLFRGLQGGTPTFGTSEFLRTLGALLDEMRADSMGLMETSDGFWLSARVNGEARGETYTYADLMQRAANLRKRQALEAVR